MSNGKRGRKAKPTNKEKDMIFTPGCVDCHMNHLPFQCPRPVMTKKLPEWEKKSIGMGKLKNPLDSKDIPPPSHHQSSQVMRGFQNAPFQMQPHYNNERKPQSRRNDTMRASKSAYAAATAPVKKHVRPANEQHMRKLNDLLRPFSYGSDDLYEETQPFVKETSLANVDIQICQTRPKVPPGKMWIFESRTIYDENGNCVSAREGAMEVSLASRMHNEPIVIVSMNDSMCF